jgi:hypothetical protein
MVVTSLMTTDPGDGRSMQTIVHATHNILKYNEKKEPRVGIAADPASVRGNQHLHRGAFSC